MAVAVVGLGLLTVGLPAQVAPRVVLVELFTSEGCSSCPPADALLRALNGTHSATGDLIVGISEHVTYWNQLGWKDPFSSEIVTERQNAYGGRFQSEVYTPQMVVNGEEQVLGSDRAAVTRAIGRVHHGGAAVHIVSAKAEGDGLAITFRLAGVERADVFAVVAEDAVSTSVLRGENGGRTLSHVAVATTFAKVASGGVGEKTVQLKVAPGRKRHLILFAQAPGLGAVLAVDSVGL
jgi:hypothetical protein